MLTRLGLAENIRALSTISGGTIIGTVYALSRAERKSFNTFYEEFYATLLHRNVVKGAFARLRDDVSRSPSLIRAAASVYAEDGFARNATLGDLAESEHVPDELIFSATEFEGGRAFRFQTSRRASVYVGSESALSVPDPLWREIQLADVVAASSCFPSAFEPFLFPDDFAWKRPLPQVRGALGVAYERPLPLMDGGAYDNQGVNGVRTAYRRKDMQLGWMLISDSSPRRGKDAFYTPETDKEGRITFGAAAGLVAALLIASLLSLISLVVDAAGEITGNMEERTPAVLD
jgi:hypothetical protein